MATERSLVDGGYADNSGLVTLVDVVDGLLQHGVAQQRIHVLIITSDPGAGAAASVVPDYAHTGFLTQLLGPVNTVTGVRNGRQAGACGSCGSC